MAERGGRVALGMWLLLQERGSACLGIGAADPAEGLARATIRD
jgi:hypothetical protein